MNEFSGNKDSKRKQPVDASQNSDAVPAKRVTTKDGPKSEDNKSIASEKREYTAFNDFEHLTKSNVSRCINAQGDTELSVSFELSPAESVLVSGYFSCRVTHGTVCVHGFTLHPSSSVYSTNPDAVSETGGSKNNDKNHCSVSESKTMANTPTKKAIFASGIWEPRPCFVAGLRGARVCISGIDHSKEGVSAGETGDSSISFQIFTMAMAIAMGPEMPFFQYPATWFSIAESILSSKCKHIRILICGGKASGKSTFARFILNHCCSALPTEPNFMQRRSYLVNIDTGQSELTPPGIISSHRLDKCCAYQPLQCSNGVNLQLCGSNCIASYFIGTPNPELHPPLFKASIEALIERTAQEAKVCKDGIDASLTVVNTPGWIQGFGLKAISNSFKCLQPTHIVVLSSNIELDTELEAWRHEQEDAQKIQNGVNRTKHSATTGSETLSQIIRVPPRSFQAQSNSNRPRRSNSRGRLPKLTPAQLRDLSMTQYFASMFTENMMEMTHVTDKMNTVRYLYENTLNSLKQSTLLGQQLTIATPFQVDFADIVLEILHGPILPRKYYLAAFNAGIVGLCCLQNRSNPEVFGQYWTESKKANSTITISCNSTSSTRDENEASNDLLASLSGGDEKQKPAIKSLCSRSLILDSLPSVQSEATEPIFRCLGLGIVRAIDPIVGKLYVLTPVPDKDLQKVDLLIKGTLTLPAVLASSGEAATLPEPYFVRQSLRSTDAGVSAIYSSNNTLRPGEEAKFRQRQHPSKKSGTD